jgi:hypothetical protein
MSSKSSPIKNKVTKFSFVNAAAKRDLLTGVKRVTSDSKSDEESAVAEPVMQSKAKKMKTAKTLRNRKQKSHRTRKRLR